MDQAKGPPAATRRAPKNINAHLNSPGNTTADTRDQVGDDPIGLLPADFAETHPILARHWFDLPMRDTERHENAAVDLIDDREIYWKGATAAVRLPAKPAVILTRGGRI